MTARLPIPGSDDGQWGTILNDFLSQAHNPDGSLRQLDQSQIKNLVNSLAAKVNTTDLAPVATSGSYADLTNTPTIPDISNLVANSALDAQTAGLISDTASQTATNLKTAYGPLNSFHHSGEALRHKLETNQDCVWSHLGDSTGNGTDEWVYLAAQSLGTSYPNQRITHELWNDTTQAYDAPTVIQAGNGGGVAPAPVVHDTFTRTAAALAGTAADTGQTWTDGPGALDGSAYNLSAGPADIVHNLDPNGAGGVLATGIFIIAAGTTSGSVRFHLGTSGANEVFAEVLVVSSGTAIRLAFWQRVTGTATSLGTSPVDIPASTASNLPFTVTLSELGTSVAATLTCAGVTRSMSATLSVPGGTSWAGFTARNLQIQSTAAGFTADEISVGLNAAASPIRTLRVINGSMPGASTTYLQPRQNIMVPTAPDLLTVSTSHNHGTQAVSDYLTAVDTLVASVVARFPNTGVALSSQNPEFAPVTDATSAAHLARLQSLRPHVAEKGWGYIAVVEAFLIRSDRGASWVNSDGVHPSPASGSPAWRDAALAYLRG